MPSLDPHTTTAPRRRGSLLVSILQIVAYFAYVVVVYIEVLLLLRVALLFFSANPASPFVEFVYTHSAQFMAPFRGAFPTQPATLTGGYLDTSALLAAVVYLILVALVQGLLTFLDRRR